MRLQRPEQANRAAVIPALRVTYADGRVVLEALLVYPHGLPLADSSRAPAAGTR